MSSGTITVITPPAAEPLSLEEAKLHLRVDSADDNALISALIQAAREHAEGITGKALVSQTLELTLDDWPADDVICLPRPPVTGVTSITATDVDGSATVMPATDYCTDLTGLSPRVTLADGAAWPAVNLKPIGGIKVRFVAGFGVAGSSVPAMIRQAMLLMIGHWYEHREEVITGTIVSSVPFAADALLKLERVP